ncbi:MAG: glycoside hydrolase family 127 protein [Armatimonadota bacterium]|nr:MAG: glycoside hydrolase family 127 protein [Armatimonadota bacterium]
MPSTTRANDFYVGNRAPLLPSPLIKLPAGSVRPEGWLRHQLDLMAQGFSGRLIDISQWCRFEGSAWADAKGNGEFGWEELPYWLKGFTSLAYALHDERLIAEAQRWLEPIIASQDADGYFGPRVNREAPDLWPNMIALYALRTHYEATADERVISLMTKYFRWQAALPIERFLPGSWQQWRGGDNLDSIYWLYNRTGESWLLDLARVNHERTADWTGGIPTWHGVNVCQGFREPGEYYQQSGDRRYLQATQRNYDTIMREYGQVPGGMFGADENCRPGYTGPRQAAETCSMAELMHSSEMLARITGDPLWADRCEEVAFNSLPASQTPDYKGLHYLTAPNMVQLDRENKSPGLQNAGCMLAYDPTSYRCCQHNIAFAWPYFAEHLWMATPSNGLAAVLYAPSEVTAKAGPGAEVRIAETTDYPFGETVEFRLATNRPAQFPLLLRVPGWCERPRVEINGEPLEVLAHPSCWIAIERTWRDGDVLRLTLPMTVRVRVWEQNNNAVSVSRGPLTYSLRIGERWARYGDSDEWPAYEVFPTTPWNYGLIVDMQNPARSFEVIEKPGPLPGQPFDVEAAPVQLSAKARRIPEWRMDGGLVGELQMSPAKTSEAVESVTLVPMGCGRLRIAAFPTVSDGPDAHEWVAAPEPPLASHCWPNDTVRALNDGIVPKRSSDQSIPRMTWWDHKGTTEWVAYRFDAPRELSWSEVYWFDDTGVGECRVPARWRLLWKNGEAWEAVNNASDYGVQLDEFNRVTFEPVVTTDVKLEVELQPGFSGGIQEWRLGRS